MSDNIITKAGYNRTLYVASWLLVLYTVVIIAWGAWVRISGSGDGCGDHWPLCHGAAVPLGSPKKTWIEVSHRYSTALFGILVLLQIVFIRRETYHGNIARRWVWITLFFTLTEALFGRALVKNGLVNESEDLGRLVVMPLHLLNTSLLLFSEVVTAEGIRFFGYSRSPLSRKQRTSLIAILVGLGLLLTTGAIAALGSHLMPSSSFVQGLQHDFSPDAHLAVRLRVIHPLLALLIPMLLWLYLSNSTNEVSDGTEQSRAAYRHLAWGALVTIFIGILTLGLLSPTWLKLSHLLAANFLVILASRAVFHSLWRPLRTEKSS
jgi:cytochrome c oxidase assembly protein subunit 15